MTHDDDEFAAFVRANNGQLWRAAWLLCGNWSTAEDLAQIGLAAVWRHWADIRRTDAPQVYAHRAIVNAYLRDRRRRWTGEIPTDDIADVAGRVGPVDPGASEDIQTRDVLLRALNRLPPRQRSVLVLRYFLDLPERSVADLLGCSVGAVKSHSSKALRSLRGSHILDDLLTEGVDR